MIKVYLYKRNILRVRKREREIDKERENYGNN